MISATKIVEIAYGHHLPKHEGKCRFKHGHSGKIEITVARKDGGVSDTGMVIDFGVLKDTVEAFAASHLDHRYLNELKVGNVYTEELVSDPTAENICKWIANRLDKVLLHEKCFVLRIKFWESSTSYVEWMAD